MCLCSCCLPQPNKCDDIPYGSRTYSSSCGTGTHSISAIHSSSSPFDRLYSIQLQPIQDALHAIHQRRTLLAVQSIRMRRIEFPSIVVVVLAIGGLELLRQRSAHEDVSTNAKVLAIDAVRALDHLGTQQRRWIDGDHHGKRGVAGLRQMRGPHRDGQFALCVGLRIVHASRVRLHRRQVNRSLRGRRHIDDARSALAVMLQLRHQMLRDHVGRDRVDGEARVQAVDGLCVGDFEDARVVDDDVHVVVVGLDGRGEVANLLEVGQIACVRLDTVLVFGEWRGGHHLVQLVHAASMQ
mmetsp:Transcript_16871/g.46625  ORF Transcript_16871/g.46625 Transcript_16871/m.46625 type:complete len:296 (-) Transcript_16871:212-1099(-)